MQRKCIEQHKMYRTTTTKKQRKYEICPCNTKGIKVILSIKKKKKKNYHVIYPKPHARLKKLKFSINELSHDGLT